MASVFRPWVKDKRTGKTVRARNYVLQYRDPISGKKRRYFTRKPAKKVAEIVAAKFLERIELEAAGVLPRQSEHLTKPLASLLTAFVGSLESRGLTYPQTRLIDFRLQAILRLTRWTLPNDMTAASLETALAQLKAEGRSAKTINAYLHHAKQWTKWMRLPVPPFADLRPYPTKAKEKRLRRALTDDEATRLLQAAIASPDRVEGYSGEDRYWAYQLAMATGLRANEIRSLTQESFNWTTRTVRVFSGNAKNRKEANQPIPLELIGSLRAYIESRPAGRVWKRMKDAAAFLQHDLSAAGIPYQQGEEGRYADFHSLRYTFGTRLARAGVRPSVAQTLMRHSDIRMTLTLYSGTEAEEPQRAVDSLPQYAPRDAPDSFRNRQESAGIGKVEGKAKGRKKRE